RAVEAVGPEMRPVRGVDQLRSDPHATACLANRTFQDVADTEFAAHPLHVDRLAFVSEGRIAGDDEEPADARERSDDLLDHAVGEVFLFGVAAHVREWQNRNGRLVGERYGGRLWRWS